MLAISSSPARPASPPPTRAKLLRAAISCHAVPGLNACNTPERGPAREACVCGPQPSVALAARPARTAPPAAPRTPLCVASTGSLSLAGARRGREAGPRAGGIGSPTATSPCSPPAARPYRAFPRPSLCAHVRSLWHRDHACCGYQPSFLLLILMRSTASAARPAPPTPGPRAPPAMM